MTDSQNTGPWPTVRTSRSEQIMYGPFAGIVRRLGDASVAVEEARELVREQLLASQEDDQVSMGLARRPAGFDASGRSPHTLFLERLFREIEAVERLAVTAYRTLPPEMSACHTKARDGVDSLEVPA